MFCDGGSYLRLIGFSENMSCFKQGEWVCTELVFYHFLHGEISCLGYDNEYLKQQGGSMVRSGTIGTEDEGPRVLALSLRLKEY